MQRVKPVSDDSHRSVRGHYPMTLVFLFLLLSVAAPAQKHPEYRVKAMLLKAVSNHVNWPRATNRDNGKTPFVISIIGENPFGDYLEITYRRRKIKEKKVKINYITRIEEIPGSDLLFISELSTRRLLKILEFTRERSVLTMGDTEGYEKRGVHINLFFEKKKGGHEDGPSVAFAINETAVRRAGLLLMDPLLERASRIIDPFPPYREKSLQLRPIVEMVEWPKKPGGNPPADTFNIVVIGKNVFDGHLEAVYKDKRLKGKPIKIIYISEAEEIAGATPRLLFICGSEAPKLRRILSYTATKPILTVSDNGDFARWGVHVNFYYDGGKLRFEINLGAARKAGLLISGDLLKMATLVSGAR